MKLDSVSNQVYVVALNEARLQGHEYVTPEHFLYAAIMFDIGKEIIENSGGDIKKIIKDLYEFFDTKIPKKTSETPVDSTSFVQMFEMATAQAHSSSKAVITVGDLLVAIFNLQESFAVYIMLKNGVDKLELLKYISHEVEREDENESIEISSNMPRQEKEVSFLQTYTVNLTEKAKKMQLDPVIGREEVLERTVQVLCRRLKNNPVHVGDPGVGKTSIVEGLAQMIADGKVPEILLDAQIFYIDIGAVLAGTKYRGDFEERLLKLLEIISQTKTPIIYIDEIHNVVGAGAVSGGGMDATSILKPYLSKGELRFIGSTTFEEYKKYFEKDRALSRRFQKIDVDEPSIEDSIKILKGIKHKYEEFHNVLYSDEIIKSICSLTGKYMQDRFLPDKAIDVMDETGSFSQIKLKNNFTRVISQKDIERTIALMTKIPEKTITGSEMDKLKSLEENLKQQVFGQDKAIEVVVEAIKASRSGLNDSEKPVASLLFVGPTGVGKTEVAKQLAVSLGIKLQRFDMSEYQEKHSVARLIGSPPGYVGYDEGGLLTEAIRKTPHSVLLLDEIEKAHGDIFNVLLQIMDYGSLTDNTGKKADFRNIIIIMTSNAGAKELNKRLIGFDEKNLNVGAINKEVERLFSPEFRNRLDATIVFNHVDRSMAESIAKKAVTKLSERLIDKNIKIKLTEQAIDYISEKGLSEIYGAREILRVVDKEIKKCLVDEVLFGKLTEGGTVTVDYKKEKIEIRTRAKRKR